MKHDINHKKIFTTGVIIYCFGALVCFHFRRDIFYSHVDIKYYVLKSDTTYSGERSRYQILLVSNAPYLKQNIKRCLEEIFWNNLSLDTLEFSDYYSIIYYRETKYLNSKFKEGNQYVPLYSHWDNTMDWRNHNEDRLGIVSFIKRKNGTVFYSTTTYDAGYGFRMLVNTSKEEDCVENYESSIDLYIRKCNELGIKKNDMENDENF